MGVGVGDGLAVGLGLAVALWAPPDWAGVGTGSAVVHATRRSATRTTAPSLAGRERGGARRRVGMEGRMIAPP
jgi:hypothetical protein